MSKYYLDYINTNHIFNQLTYHPMAFSKSKKTNSGFFSNIFTKDSPTDNMKGGFKLSGLFIILIIVCIIGALV